MKFNPLDHPICFMPPRRMTTSSWYSHIPFAMYLVDVLRPKMIVELGAGYGDSYCAFCQAVSELGLEAKCCAIDTWQGDPHSGHYGPEVFSDLSQHHDSLYGDFSELFQLTFDEALQSFEDGVIDLLHIDGYHTYEAVSNDFNSWLPKMSERGVVLLHDTNVKEGDFGVWRLWEEVIDRYPHFEFFHGHGLGVLAVGREQPKALNDVLEAEGEEAEAIRSFFYLLGDRLELKERTLEIEAVLEDFLAKSRYISDLQEEFDEKAAWADELSRQLGEREEQLGRLHREFEDKSSWALDLDNTLKEREEQLGRLQREFEDKSSWALDLGRRLKEREEQLGRLQQEFEDKSSWALDLDHRLKERDEQIGRLQRELEDKSSWAVKLSNQNESLRQEIKKAQKRIEELEIRILDLRNYIHDAQRRLAYKLMAKLRLLPEQDPKDL